MEIEKVISTFRKLEKGWPKGYSLYARPGTLMIIADEDLQIVAEIDIPSDGGDPYITIKEGKLLYLNLGNLSDPPPDEKEIENGTE